MNQIETVLDALQNDPQLGPYIDMSLRIPEVFHGAGSIRLIILGQDPTVDNPASRQRITTVLNLDKSSSLTTYLRKMCGYLEIDLYSQVYATNLFKNFFTLKPTENKTVDIFKTALPYWLPVLQAELDQFPTAPVLILGEPLLKALCSGEASPRVKDYWGWTPRWKAGEALPFAYLEPGSNQLQRVLFPYPHLPSWQHKKFYFDRLEQYSVFAREAIQKLAAQD